MKTAYKYKRVSSKDQKDKKNSIPEQDNRIENYAKENNIKIIRDFWDSESAFHDSKRENFNKMLELAIIEKPDYIILDDSSRFARTREVAIESKKILRSYGVEILYASEPYVDPNTVSGFWYESIQEIKNESTSKEISFHTKKGMIGNVQQRDEETGWCYKNGGKPPFGYKRTQLYRGIDRKGKPIYKTIWEIDENNAKILRMILLDLYIKQDMSYDKIRDYLNEHSIKNSNGNLWSTSTISSMLRKERLESYNGTSFWNMENKHVKGIKYNEREKWIICNNAHPKIISDDELQIILEKRNRNVNRPYKYNKESQYLLSSMNAENEFLFVCSECNGHVVGSCMGKGHNRKYACSNNRTKGQLACKNNWKVNQEWIESIIFEIIQNKYTTNKGIKEFVKKIQLDIKNIRGNYDIEIKDLKSRINKIEQEIQNLLISIKNGINIEIGVEEINKSKEEQNKLKEKLNILEIEQKKEVLIKEQDILDFLTNIKKVLENANIQEKRELIKTFVRKIVLDEKNRQIELELYPDFSVVHNVGAGSENRTRATRSEAWDSTTKLYPHLY